MSQINQNRQITVSEMAPHVHSFLPGENKVNKISTWLVNWIKTGLENKQIEPYDFLPSKGDLAFHIGVSLGTIQNVYRMVEDMGYIESRQKIGTYIKQNKEDKNEKLTSKREVAVEMIKNYLAENGYKNGDILISTRKLSDILCIPFGTIRIAINTLIIDDILEKRANKFVVKSMNYKINNLEQQSLVEKIAEKINQYIKNNLKAGDKIPSNSTLSDMYQVSIKTIHDAIKILSLAGIVKTRRGYYGTVVTGLNEEREDLYYYEQVEQSIKKYIAENCEVGTKLPSIKEFAEVFNISTKTIKNALNNLEDDGYINFQRGRYGGTFVTEIPVVYEQSYTWLALSPNFEQSN